MKQKIKYIASILLLASIVSCTDLLTEKPVSYYNYDEMFSSLETAQLALNGIYATLCNPNHYGQDEMAMPTSDDMYFVQGTNSDGTRRDISHYKTQASNSWIESLWLYKYDGINRANHVIYNIQLMPEYAEGNSEALRIEGQARFMRALLAFDLIRYWGDVPYKEEYTVNYEQAYNEKVDKEVIYDKIIEDLNIAKERLPWADNSWNPERPSQSSARALLMRVYLHRAGYSLSSKAVAGSALTRPDDALRAGYFEKIIEEYRAFQANGFNNLSNQSYRNYWKGFCEKRLDPVETLFEIAFFTPDGNNQGGGCWGTYIGPWTDPNSKYGRANAFFRVLPEWYNVYYEDKDQRKRVNICNYEINADGDSVPPTPTNSGNPARTFFPGKWRREWMTNQSKSLNNVDVNYVFLRYADVMLMAAEALNETGGAANQAEAKELINTIRRRSGATEWTDDASYQALYKKKTSGNNGVTMDISFAIPDNDEQGKIRTALFWERGFELCYEGLRKYDLIRWGILGKLFKGWNMPKFSPGFNTQAVTNSASWGFQAPLTFTEGKHELFPIPLSEIQVNYKLNNENNPGY